MQMMFSVLFHEFKFIGISSKVYHDEIKIMCRVPIRSMLWPGSRTGEESGRLRLSYVLQMIILELF